MTTPHLPWPGRRRGSNGAPEIRWARAIGAVVLAAFGVLMFVKQSWIRDDEAHLAGNWFGAVLDGSAKTSHNVVYFSWLGRSEVGMRISTECTVAMLTAPLCIVAAALLMFARARWSRLVVGLAVGLTILVGINQLRLALIAVSMQHWGMTGYDVSHKFLGTVVALAGFVVGVLTMLRIATSDHQAS
jgi:exosortase/archaeosortase family protein